MLLFSLPTFMKRRGDIMSSQTSSSQGLDWGSIFGGILVLLCGIAVIFWPGITLEIIAALAGITLVVAGIFNFISWARNRNTTRGSGWTLAYAICDAVLGILFLIHPLIAAGVITFFLGCLVVIYGVFAIVTSFGVRKLSNSWWLMLLNGIISLICGYFFMFSPEFFAIFLGVFLVMQGVTMVVYGIFPPRDDLSY